VGLHIDEMDCAAMGDLLMRTERECYKVVSGDIYDEITVIYTGKNVLLRPIFIENDVGERDILCYVPQNLQANENEPFTQMVCDLLRAGMQEAFPSGGASGSGLS
jgi:hypothetical protein